MIEQLKYNFKKVVKSKGIYLAMGTTFIGLFFGIPLLFWFSRSILISVEELFILIFICGLLGLIQWKFVANYFEMKYHQYAMYSFSGFGMCLVNFLLFLNFYIRVGNHAEMYDMTSINISKNNFDVAIEGKSNSPFARNLSQFLQTHFDEIPEAQRITVVYDTGLLGFEMISDCKFH